MDLEREAATTAIFQALAATDGDRQEAAKKLNMSIRTFYRYLDKLDLHPMLERCGWRQHGGPPRRGHVEGFDIIRTVVERHIMVNNNEISYPKLALEIYGLDSPDTRKRLFTVVDVMKKKGYIASKGAGKWEVKA